MRNCKKGEQQVLGCSIVPQHEPHFNEYLIIMRCGRRAEVRERKIIYSLQTLNCVRALSPINGLGCEFNNDKSIIDCREYRKVDRQLKLN